MTTSSSPKVATTSGSDSPGVPRTQAALGHRLNGQCVERSARAKR
jgi:hypothetical protein